jgi:branched-subunit amino acid aminotransferase/4-amino-4-deoxychorismate lyase
MNRRPELIETVRVRAGTTPLWGHHLARLFAACRPAGVEPPGTLLAPSGGADRIHRLLVSARGIETSERAVGSLAPVRLVTAAVLHAPYPFKTTDRAQFDRARAAAEAAGADDGILLTAGGWVAETAVWGVYWWEGGRLAAPPMDFGILDSVARRRIVELAGEIAERRVSPDQLPAAGAFVANAARGVVPIESVNGRKVIFSRETTALAAAFWG